MDSIFKALADPARRTLLDSLRDRDGQSLQDLEVQLDMTRFGVMKHLGVLEDAGLIVTRKTGRYKHHFLNALPLQEAIDRWIDPYRVKPAARAVLELKARLEGTEAMANSPDVVVETYIRCTPDALWSALKDPAAHAAFNHLAPVVERDGNQLIYSADNGARVLIFTETEETPKTRIAATFQPYWPAALPVSHIVYTLAPEGDHCRLTLEHYDLSVEMNGVQEGWGRTLSGLKTWLETGRAAKFPPTAA